MTESIDYCKKCYHTHSQHFGDFECAVADCECDGYVLGETRVTSETGGAKGTKEERYDLIPIHPLNLLARLYAFGARKYAAHNWRKGYDWSKSYAAAQRHLTAFWDGEDIDPESKVPHVINVVFHMFVLAQFMKDFPQYDDRFKPEAIAKKLDEENGDINRVTNIFVENPLPPKTPYQELYEVWKRTYAGGDAVVGRYLSKEEADNHLDKLLSTPSRDSENVIGWLETHKLGEIDGR